MVDFDCVIVGAGVTGATAAVTLAQEGFSILLVEKGSVGAFNRKVGRGISISKGSKDVLAHYGIWSEVSGEAGEIHKIIVRDYNAKSLGLSFDNRLVSQEPLGYIIKEQNLIAGLARKISNTRNIKVLDNTVCDGVEFEDFQASVTLSDNSRVSAKIVIVADGKHSETRKRLGISIKNKAYNQTALICNISHEFKHNNCAYELFYKNGPFALLPLYSQNESAVVWAESDEISFSEMPIDLLEQALAVRCADTHGKIKIINNDIACFPLSLSYMTDYYKKRAVFIGDSLHSIHPLAGQGYNLTVRDISSLTNLIKEYQDLGLNIGSQILLERFQKSRKLDNIFMIRATDGIDTLFSNDNSILSGFRSVGLEVLNNFDFLKKRMMKYAMGE